VTSGVPLETTAPPKTREWKFWATILWVAASVAAFFIVGVLLVLPLLGMLPSELKSHPLTNAVGWLIPWFGALGVFALAIRLTGIGMRDYLALVPPRLPDIGIGLAGLVVLLVAMWLLYTTENAPSPSLLDPYRRAVTEGSWPQLLFEGVVVAPVAEELLFRGFLYHGWAASRIGPTGAIVLTSAAWMIIHTQKNWLGLTYIFGVGLLYGSIRRWSGSTATTVILHCINNALIAGYLLIVTALGWLDT